MSYTNDTKPTTSYSNDTKPTTSYSNDTKPTTNVGELWNTITTTWATETRKWIELAGGNVYTNDIKP